jgi:hypothetical protein
MEEVEPVEVGCDPGDPGNLPGGLADERVQRVPCVHIRPVACPRPRPSRFASTVPHVAITSPRTRSRKTRSRSTSRTSTPSLANVIAIEEPASPPPTTSTSKLGPCPTTTSLKPCAAPVATVRACLRTSGKQFATCTSESAERTQWAACSVVGGVGLQLFAQLRSFGFQFAKPLDRVRGLDPRSEQAALS